MTTQEFNNELGSLINHAMCDGVAQNKMGPDNIVGIMEMHKSGLLRFLQEASAAQAAAQAPIILPPRNGRPPV